MTKQKPQERPEYGWMFEKMKNEKTVLVVQNFKKADSKEGS